MIKTFLAARSPKHTCTREEEKKRKRGVGVGETEGDREGDMIYTELNNYYSSMCTYQ